MDLTYGIDEVEIEDPLIQLDITRERSFINQKNKRIINEPRPVYTDVIVGNVPNYVYLFGIDNVS